MSKVLYKVKFFGMSCELAVYTEVSGNTELVDVVASAADEATNDGFKVYPGEFETVIVENLDTKEQTEWDPEYDYSE